MPVASTLDYYRNRNALIRMGRNERLKRARQQQRLARATLARKGQITRSRGVFRTGGTLQLETNFFDSVRTNVVLTNPTNATGGEVSPNTIGCLNGVPQGDTSSNRSGSKILMKSIFINGSVHISDADSITSAQASPTIFIAPVLDTQTNGAQLNSEDVYSNVNATPDAAITPLRNMSYTERFKVLKTKTITLKPTQTFDGTDIARSGCSRPFKMKVNLRDMQTKFQTGTTTGYVGTIIDNSLHMLAWCDDDDMGPALTYASRLRFKA